MTATTEEQLTTRVARNVFVTTNPSEGVSTIFGGPLDGEEVKDVPHETVCDMAKGAVKQAIREMQKDD